MRHTLQHFKYFIGDNEKAAYHDCSVNNTFQLKGVFSPNPPFFYESARLAPYELTHVRASPGDCAAGWAQAWRKI